MMINTPTVFILGAGASTAYGFPTGDGLTQEILDRTNLNNAKNEDLITILDDLDFDPAILEPLRKNLSLSRQTIDVFIEKNQEYAALTKYLITECLLNCEKRPVESGDPKEDWYTYLWKQITKNGLTFDELKKNRLTILTFNYDRSLEEFLILTSKALYPEVRANLVNHSKILEMLPIIHLHGSVGSFVSQGQIVEHTYGKIVKPLAIREMSRLISFVHEDNVTTEDKIYDRLVEAKRIYFLGFGYHEQNLKKIGINHLVDPSKEVLGTTYGMGNQEIEQIVALTNNNMKLNVSHNMRVSDFLKSYVKFY